MVNESSERTRHLLGRKTSFHLSDVAVAANKGRALHLARGWSVEDVNAEG